MRWLSPLLPLLILCSTTWASTTNSTQYPLFPSSSPEANEPPLQLLHTSLSTLLPILPALSPPPSHTLLVTLATPAFKPLLFNWICFLRHKAHWGEGESPNQDDSPEEAEHRRRQLKGPAKDLIKLLVVTSDEQLARELTDEHGVVVWWLKGVDWDQEERRAKEAGDGKQEDDVSNQARIERILTDDLFTSLRSMDLLLPPHPPSKQQQGMLEWGSLHYQSLMLERTLVMTALTGALVESQKVEREDREREEAEWKARVLAHDWEESRLMREPFVGVKGVLLVDNDAVWLSNPTSHLTHPYRPTGSHPSILFSPDMSPEQQNSWGTHSMPCACFIYSRTSDVDSATAAVELKDEQDEYLPAEGAALAWRWTAMCHVSMLLKSLEKAKEQAKWIMYSEEDEDADLVEEAGDEGEEPQEKRIGSLVKAVAPSFQATSLGPALFLAEQGMHTLPVVSHRIWMDVMSEGGDFGVEGLEQLLEEAGMGDVEGEEAEDDDEWDHEEDGPPPPRRSASRRTTRLTCDELAQLTNRLSPNPSFHPPTTSLTRTYYRSPFNHLRPHPRVRSEPLPYDLFPPGMRFFGGGMEEGTRACVVHANYATGSAKAELLRSRGLWALRGDGQEGWTCDAEVLRRA